MTTVLTVGLQTHQSSRWALHLGSPINTSNLSRHCQSIMVSSSPKPFLLQPSTSQEEGHSSDGLPSSTSHPGVACSLLTSKPSCSAIIIHPKSQPLPANLVAWATITSPLDVPTALPDPTLALLSSGFHIPVRLSSLSFPPLKIFQKLLGIRLLALAWGDFWLISNRLLPSCPLPNSAVAMLAALLNTGLISVAVPWCSPALLLWVLSFHIFSGSIPCPTQVWAQICLFFEGQSTHLHSFLASNSLISQPSSFSLKYFTLPGIIFLLAYLCAFCLSPLEC